ncbi:MAG TPA: anaerobic sulfatase maturase, partial [Phycisphaerales bacterium]|nr:anaerobic sulfatase maturase [Phycisphaerales bacterium]
MTAKSRRGFIVRPFTLLIKPSGPDCNINCSYCFYACKSSLFGGSRHRMSDEVLEKLVSSYLPLRFPNSSFAWQGGEPTLMGLDFFKRVVELQRKYGEDGQVVTNALQTNGILLDDQWCKFLHEYKFLVGISLDGPEKFHNHHRMDFSGKGTFDRVMASIERCKQNKVEFNILVLLSDHNVGHPDEIFDFFMEQKIRFLQFVQCVEPDPETGDVTDFSITPRQYGEFLCRIFDRWVEHGITKLSVRTFDSLLSYCVGQGQTECTFQHKCSDYIVVEHNGDVFCCDFFVEEQWRIGNIMETPIEELASSKMKRQFSRQKQSIDNKCLI